MKKRLLSLRTAALLSLGFAATLAPLNAQPIADGDGDVVIGTNIVEPTAILDLVSTNKGFLVPRMSQVQRNLIPAPADALMIFNTTTSEFNYWDPSTGQWEVFITSANIEDYAWVLGGNNLDIAVDPLLQSAYDGTNGAFLGTNSADNAVIATTQGQAIDFFTNATRRFSIEAADGDIVPTNDNDIDLGSDANRFAEVYVNGSSVHIGPSGGEGAGTEMDLGYAANQGTITVDNTPTPQLIIDAAASRMYLNADGTGLDEVQINGAIDGVFINPDGSGPSEFFVSAAGDVIVMDPDGNGNNEVVLNPTTLDIDVNTFIDADDDGTQNVSVTAAGVAVDGDDDGNNDIFVDGGNGDVTIGNNTATDLMTVNGRVEQSETDGFDGYLLQESGSGNGFTTIESDDGDAYFAVESGFGNGMLIVEQDDGNGIFVEESGAGNGITIFSGSPGIALEVNGSGAGVALQVNGGFVDGNFNSNEFGDGSAVTQLTVQGVQDAIGTETLPNAVWDLAVNGDIAATGMVKSGAGVWLDGVSGTHSVTADQPLDVQTMGANTLRLATNSTPAVVVDGTTQNVNILQDADVDGNMNVDGATTLQSTLFVDGATTLDATLVVNGTTTLNAPLTVNAASTFDGTIDQINGGDVNFSGNVDAESGLDVTGQDLTVGPNFDVNVTTGTVSSQGAGNSFGNGAAVQQVVVNGTADAVGGNTLAGNPNVWDLVVQGDMVTTGIAKMGGSIWIDGRTPGDHSITSNDNLRIEVSGAGNQLEIVSEGGIVYETAGNYRFIGDQATAGGGQNPVPNPEDHVVIIENTNTGDGNGNGLAIVIEDNVSAFSNNYISFYRGSTGSDMSGRIEGFSRQDFVDLSAEIASVVSNPGNYNPFNYIDFDFPITYNSNFISFSGGSLPSLSGGSLPSLNGGSLPSASFNFTDGLSFSPGSLPSLNVGSLPTLNVGSLPTLNFSAPFTFGTPTFGFDFTGGGTLTGELLNTVNPGLAWSIYGDPVGSGLLFVDFANANYKGGVTYESGSGDYAEWLEREDHAEDIKIGEVVGVRGGKVSKQTEGADQLMVVSWKPAVLGNMPDQGSEENYEKIAFMGQIPVKVLGDVNVGDYLIASGLDNGMARAVAPEAMTAELADQVVGVAWTSAKGNGVNLVKAAVGLKPHEYMQVIRNQEERIDELEERLERLEKQMNGPQG